MLKAGFIEVMVWRAPGPPSGSTHGLEYRFAYVVESECVLRHDDDAGKGDHRHVGTRQMPHVFVSVDPRLDDVIVPGVRPERGSSTSRDAR